MIERRIVIGLITSTEFLQEIRPLWDNRLLKSNAARRLAHWSIEYFDKYKVAPMRQMEAIFYDKVKKDKVPNDVAEEIEQDILPGLSEEYEQGINYAYLLEQAKEYLLERSLVVHTDKIKALLEEGKVADAEAVALNFAAKIKELSTDIDLSTEQSLDRIDAAFAETGDIVISYPGALGELWNDQLVRGAFVALMASEKRGKSYMLLDFAMRAAKQGKKVAFFQAGDMTEGQQLRRMCVYQAKRSDKEKYCGTFYIPTKDCIYNQFDECDKAERECDFGIFTEKEKRQLKPTVRASITLEMLKEKVKENPDYRPCHNCSEWRHKPWGAIWLKKKEVRSPLNAEIAKTHMKEFFIDKRRQFRLSTHANGTLSVGEIEAIMDKWEKNDGFVPHLIVVDYADLLIGTTKEFRHQQNEIWKGLRSLSQKKHALVITVTQADAKSYEKDRITLANYSEDKRKYAHVTAIYALNQDNTGREKEIGIMRIGELLIREGEGNSQRDVYVLQSLRTGQPIIGSFW